MSTAPHHPMRAIGMMLGAVFLLSTMDVAIKQLVAHYGSFQVVFLRCVLSAPLFAAWMLIRERQMFRMQEPANHLLRALLGVIMLFAVGECFRELALADAYAIFFAAPLLITLLSGPFLGEPAGPARLIAAAVGFCGVLIVLKPGGSGLISYGSIMGLVGVVCYAFTALLLRRVGHKQSSVNIAFWFTALTGVASGVLAIGNWTTLEPAHWPWIALMGVTGTFGALMLTIAFRQASVAVVAPFDYSHMLWAVIYGYLLWGDLPGIRTWIGTAVITASGLYIIYREHRIRMRSTQRVD